MTIPCPLAGPDLVRLMQRHRVTMPELKRRTGFTLKRIRQARRHGLHDRNAIRDWVQAITDHDPGVIY